MHYVSNIAGTLLLGKLFSSDDEVRKNLIHSLDMIVYEAGLAGALNFLPFLRYVSTPILTSDNFF